MRSLVSHCRPACGFARKFRPTTKISLTAAEQWAAEPAGGTAKTDMILIDSLSRLSVRSLVTAAPLP